VVHPKDKVKDEEKTDLINRVPCKNCSSSYIGETNGKFGLRIKQHKKRSGFLHIWYADSSLQSKGEQCNSPNQPSQTMFTLWKKTTSLTE